MPFYILHVKFFSKLYFTSLVFYNVNRDNNLKLILITISTIHSLTAIAIKIAGAIIMLTFLKFTPNTNWIHRIIKSTGSSSWNMFYLLTLSN